MGAESFSKQSRVQGCNPCIDSPRLRNLNDRLRFIKWGRGRAASGLACWLVCLLSANKRECPVGTPSFRSLCRIAARKRGSRPCPACGRAASHPPLRPAGRHPAHPVRRRCRRPPRPAPCGVWPGKCGGQGRASPARASWPPPLLGGTLPRRKAKPASGRAPRGLAPLLPLAGRGAGAPGRPGPHKWGLWGRPPLRPGRRHSGQPCQPGHACGAGRAARLCLRTRRPA